MKQIIYSEPIMAIIIQVYVCLIVIPTNNILYNIAINI